jgi:GNAT superfamily N-acetyltransferase
MSSPSQNLPRKRSSIRIARDPDLRSVRQWLDDEDSRGIHGNFLCNWRVIERAYGERRLLVYVDGESGLPVAYQLGQLLQSGILQVRHEYRGRGIGKKLVAYCIQLASKADESFLSIQCKPSSSIPFWEHMGFTLSNNENHAYRVLEKRFPLPTEGVPVRVVVRFFPEEKKWQDSTNPCVEVVPAAVVLADGTTKFDRRVGFHDDAFPDVRDPVVEVEREGQRLFMDKAKYTAVQARGLSRRRNGWCIDQIIAG